ncbi:MAG: hypothetical protein ACLTDV_00110 [Eubacterium sp.]
MLSTIGCGKSAQSSADSSATNHSESGFGTFQAESQKKVSAETTAEGGVTEATVNTDDTVEQSAQDSGEQGTDTTGTEFEQVEGVNTDQKLIKTVNMSAETTGFDTLVAARCAGEKTKSVGGYVEIPIVIGGNYGMTRRSMRDIWFLADSGRSVG